MKRDMFHRGSHSADAQNSRRPGFRSNRRGGSGGRAGFGRQTAAERERRMGFGGGAHSKKTAQAVERRDENEKLIPEVSLQLPKKRRKRAVKRVSFWLAMAMLPAAAIWWVAGLVRENIRQQDLVRLSGLSYKELLAETLAGQPEAAVSVAVIQGPTVSYLLYGEDAVALPYESKDYELGEMTQSFTAAMLCKAASEGLLSLHDPIDLHLDLPEDRVYPTLRQLSTHMGGYRNRYFALPMLENRYNGENPVTGISYQSILTKAGEIRLKEADMVFAPSDFGMSVLGQLLARSYQRDYQGMMNDYVYWDLALPNTRIQERALPGGWQWDGTDGYLPALGMDSNLEDMVQFLQMHMRGDPAYLGPAKITQVHLDGSSPDDRLLGISTDGLTVGWRVDQKNEIIWTRGRTDSYCAYMGYDVGNWCGIVILSNLPEEEFPAPLIGMKKIREMLEADRAGK